jgi:hypothetical protein
MRPGPRIRPVAVLWVMLAGSQLSGEFMALFDERAR